MPSASCLCGGVHFEFATEPKEISYCHCSMCQKAHGSAFGPYVRIYFEGVTITGESLITSYQSSKDITRTFCQRCGSNLQFIRHGRDYFDVAAGILDGEVSAKPVVQIWCESKADWYTFDETIPQR